MSTYIVLQACMHPGTCGCPGTSVPAVIPHCMQDPAWMVAYKDLSAVNEELSKAAVQNPLEYRALAMAAVQIGSRPHDLDVDPEQAFAFCNRFMS